MTSISQEIRINAPREMVWSILSDLGGIQSFHPAVKKSYYTSETKVGVGASRVCELLPMGKVTERVTEWREGELLKIEVINGEKMPPFKKSIGTLHLRELNEQTVVKLALSYQLKYGLIGRLMDKMMVRAQFSKMIPAVLAGLKHYAETGEEVSSMDDIKRNPTPSQAISQLQLAVA